MYGFCKYAFCLFGRYTSDFDLGATHPYAGFYGYHQDSGDVIQENLPCRPCSVFGQKPCLRGDWACMTLITPERIVEKVKASIK